MGQYDGYLAKRVWTYCLKFWLAMAIIRGERDKTSLLERQTEKAGEFISRRSFIPSKRVVNVLIYMRVHFPSILHKNLEITE